ncbi:argininosuccinate synthase [Candidatus Kaiserbacteria bacterium RIFCSPHIGHO2_12_FULL_53_13]|uniref:Argininosuccinate synthase n=1 Tax=Candidatus Kaiserbacteria bacterium RIFCSPHIGHO2_12_FULL_53_13 TaxID=1798502 RepID=A0A1F6E7Z5_9BACT|nr:MAG: argininosuccinate synthase [Candidatus Kaiserbacteria bacterium RIFCSPHIGHO2_12_FULL_53_13]OGG74220.1 MAG: argininosuccinate synthase [Candidatus Kaiserbacteria bacterium RIFCSPLOWO2_01_FULL_52_36]
MKAQYPYHKVASYEGDKDSMKKVVLLYSGGLDTSVLLKWIQDEYKVKVITLTLDLGQQHDDLDAIKQKALKFGAVKAIALDVKEEFANEYLAKGIRANAHYQGEYHLSTPMARAILAKKAVEVAEKEGADCIAHGCTGKGNDQVRLDGYILAHSPKMKIIAPVREWGMDRKEEIQYAKEHGIPVPATADFPYSDDDNMGGITWEGGEITDPSLIAQEERFLTTYTLPKNAPDKPELIKLEFKQGVPVALNGEKLSLAPLLMKLNKMAGKHGVGTFQVLEDRLIGLKNRGVYEHPGLHTIIEAHRYLERYVSTKILNEVKETIDTRWGYLCYGAYWFDPVMDAINAFNDSVNEKVTGEVTVRLFKGNTAVVAMKSPFALAFASFNNAEGYKFNVNASAGFVELYSLQMKIANEIARKKKKK